MSRIIFIGVDDTDTLDCGFGTGRVARGMAQRFVQLGLATSLGVSRHQCLVHPEVKYTSHNSAKGLAIISDFPEEVFYQPGIDFLKSIFVQGSDPGLCICPEDKVCDEVLAWAKASQIRVLRKADAIDIASRHGIWLKELGGDGGGIIGALAAVGLRAEGNDGRLVECRGINDITGILTVADLKHRTDICSVYDVLGELLPDTAVIDSRDWIKPDLVGGKPVLHVRPAGFRADEPMWETLQAKKTKGKRSQNSQELQNTERKKMTNKTDGVDVAGSSKEVESVWQDSRVKLALQALFFVLAGLLSAFLKKMHPGIGVSGSSAVYWLAPMITARILMKRDGGGTLTGLFTALWGIPFGLNNDLAHNVALYAGAGLAIDVMARLPLMDIRKAWGATLTGVAAHMVKFAIITGSALTSPVTRNFIVSGVLQSAWQHVIFGAGAGFVAWAAYKVWQSAQNRLKEHFNSELPGGK